MACACKVNQEISFLQKRYGTENVKRKKSDIKGLVGLWIREVAAACVSIVALPFVFIYALYGVFTSPDGVIRLDKAFGFVFKKKADNGR